MKSVRLNKETRKQIVGAVMSKYLENNPTPDRISKDYRASFALAVHNRVFGSAEIKAALAVIPSSILLKRPRICVLFPDTGAVEYLEYSKDSDKDATYLPTPDSAIELTPAEVELWREHRAAVIQRNREIDKHLKAQGAYRTEVATAVDSCNTTGQLVELWPEVEEFIPETLKNFSSINLPSVNVANLNAALK